MTSLVLCCTMGTTALASERTEVLSIRNDKNPNIVMQDVENATQYSANTTASTSTQYDANKVITRNNSNSGKFYGKYTYSFTSTSVTKICLNVYMPNYSGTDYLQGTITLKGSDGSNATVNIANYTGDSWTLTFTGVKPNVKYYFYYNLYSVGSSKVGYVVSQAYPK